MAFNHAMNKPAQKLHPDSKIILALGGPTALARTLCMDPSSGGVQRVQNWMTRGIPAQIRLDNFELFREAESQAAA